MRNTNLFRALFVVSALLPIEHALACPTVDISACGTLKSDVTYSLTKDVTSNGVQCFDLSHLTNVTINCNGHMISTSGSPNITIEYSNQIKFNGCNFQTPTPGYGADYFIGNNIDGLTIENSTVGSASYNSYQAIQLTQANDVNIVYNPSLNAAVQVYYGTNMHISHNTIMAGSDNATSHAFYTIELHYGSGNYAQYNTIDGRASAAIPGGGSDDGIIAYDESNDHFSYNTITNTYDAGIELAGVTDADYIHDNVISNTTLTGIGSYYWTSITNSTFANNTATNTQYLFDIFRTGGLRAAGFDYPLHEKPADSGVYFENNHFSNNVLKDPTFYDDHYSSFIPVYAQMYYTDSPAIPAADFHIAKNTFEGNNFTHSDAAPDFGLGLPNYKYVSGYVVDDGGNVCTQPTSTPYPLTCH